MADKLDRVIADYVNGRVDAKIKSIESRYLYRQKVDNLGIRSGYSGGSEQESHVISKEDLENDAELGSLKEVTYIFSMWYEPLRDVEKEVIKEVPHDKTFMESYGLPVGITVGGLGTYVLCNWKQIVKFAKSFA